LETLHDPFRFNPTIITDVLLPLLPGVHGSRIFNAGKFNVDDSSECFALSERTAKDFISKHYNH
jgi:hypothetical protein